MTKPTCFVVQGFGKKTDFQQGKTFDLDRSYAVIKEAVQDAGLSCERADEIVHSGHIESVMYERLLGADLVIADLSTLNVNAAYELGVRYALRPHATMVVAEAGINFPFDVNHITIRTYTHLGEDVGYAEARSFAKDLKHAIGTILAEPKTDSPVYTFLSLRKPEAKPHARASAVDVAPATDRTMRSLKEAAQDALNEKRFEEAASLYRIVRDRGPKDDFIVQRVALATYKSEKPDVKTALENARTILDYLKPRASFDPETLGLWQAVHKRLFELDGNMEWLDEAVFAAERGFHILLDYYNGINLAFLLDHRATRMSNQERDEHRVMARYVRRRVISICEAELVARTAHSKPLTSEPPVIDDAYYWILATLREAAVGLGRDDEALAWRDKAAEAGAHAWMLESTDRQVAKLQTLLAAP